MLINPAPSFREIANRPDTTRDSLRRFLATTHGDVSKLPLTMPDLSLTNSQKEAAIAYILSLQNDPASNGKQVDPRQ